MADLNIDRNLVAVGVEDADASQSNGTVLASYTCPAGKTARILNYTQSEIAGAATLGMFFVRDADSFELDINTISQLNLLPGLLHLEPGDKFEARVASTAVGALWDILISVEEWSARRNN